MPLSEETQRNMPAVARRIIKGALDDITPEIDLDPKKAEQVKAKIADIISDIVEEGKTGASRVVSLNYLANAINDATSMNADRTLDVHLRGIAQSIALLIGRRGEDQISPNW